MAGYLSRLFGRRPRAFYALVLGASTAPALAASAQPVVLGYANLDVVGVDGERSWLKGEQGKLRFGGDNTAGTSGFGVHPFVSEAGIVLQPKLTWSLGATVVAIAQHDQDHPVDLSEAFLTWKPMPIGDVRVAVRAGLYWPSISLEHSGPEWAVRDTITPSAIGSWIGEEVKVAGAEVTGTVPLGNHSVAVTGGLFMDNDTAGTLLAFRGWALGDMKATLTGKYDLPPRSDMWTVNQAPFTTPLYDLDNRIGWYAKLTWRPPVPIEIQAFYYDNRGDPEVIDADAQWAWRTRFGTLGAIADVGPHTRLIAQGTIGCTEMGYRNRPISSQTALDTDFRSAYLLATQTFAWGTISGRVEAFGTDAGGYATDDYDSEHGWAITAAARKPIDRYATVLLEALHVDSQREGRERLGIDPRQRQTQVRLSLRLRTSN